MYGQSLINATADRLKIRIIILVIQYVCTVSK